MHSVKNRGSSMTKDRIHRERKDVKVQLVPSSSVEEIAKPICGHTSLTVLLTDGEIKEPHST